MTLATGLIVFYFCLLIKPFRVLMSLILGWIFTMVGYLCLGAVMVFSFLVGIIIAVGDFLRKKH